MIDLLYLAHNRRRFTRQTLELLALNTNWALVDRVFLYDDSSVDGADFELADFAAWPRIAGDVWIRGPEPIFTPGSSPEPIAVYGKRVQIIRGEFGGPVAVMRHFLANFDSQFFCKIDSDTALPPLWLDVATRVMAAHPQLDLLGIECMHEIQAAAIGEPVRDYEECTHIGGIGLMRRRPFLSHLPEANGRFGFTEWQQHHPDLVRGWLRPGLPVCLLDHVPYDPWVTWSREYVRAGWQRPWSLYPESNRAMWGWIADNPPIY